LLEQDGSVGSAFQLVQHRPPCLILRVLWSTRADIRM
jgi:hypothetical protein